MNMTVGNRIKKIRTEKGISQGNLAEVLHVDRSLISKWENGKAEPPVYMYNRIAEALDQPEDIFSEKAVQNSPQLQTEDIIAVLLMILSVALSPWGLLLSLANVFYIFKKSMSVWIKILSIIIMLVLVYDMLWFYGYQFIPNRITIQ